MTEQKAKKDLKFVIKNGPPEMDLYYALARGTLVSLALEFGGTEAKRDLYINGIEVSEDNLKERRILIITGSFWGNGIDSFSNFSWRRDEKNRKERNVVLWGKCLLTYDKRSRTGKLLTKNYKLEVRGLAEGCPYKK